MPEQTNLHGTCVAVGEHGVLLLGPSGSGKSDLALRLIDEPGQGSGGAVLQTRLVADDQVLLRRADEHLIASAPPSLKGLLEVRGLGIISTCAVRDEVVLSLALRLVPSGKIERMPSAEGSQIDILGVALPMHEVAPFHASAPAFVRAAAALHKSLFSNSGEVSACEPSSFTA
ncbi:MAG: hypothetical protein GY948_03265 [Alphaproteobacteria bacterium]|nr:hypothetical protein [Alphaproteobacteria bacterium]